MGSTIPQPSPEQTKEHTAGSTSLIGSPTMGRAACAALDELGILPSIDITEKHSSK